MTWNRTIGLWLLATLCVSTLPGCATIVNGGRNEVTIDNTGGATYFSVLDRNNRVVESGMTPKQVTLKTKREWLKPAQYHVVYAGQNGVAEYPLNAGLNWWTAGNIIIGGVPGIAIDAATGALWKLDKTVIGNVPLEQIVSNQGQGAELVAAHSGLGSANTDFSTGNHQQPQIRQASFNDPDSEKQPTQPAMNRPQNTQGGGF